MVHCPQPPCGQLRSSCSRTFKHTHRLSRLSQQPARTQQRKSRFKTHAAPDEPSELQAASSQTSTTISSLSTTPYTVIQTLSAAGVLETLYLNVAKFTQAPLLCSSAGCDSVLSSAYASLYGLPLPALGLLAYAAAGALATSAAASVAAGEEPPSSVSTLLTAAATALGTTSAVLMTVLFTRLEGQQCLWCFGSAALSTGILLSAVAALPSSRYRTTAAPSVGAAFATAVVLFGGWRNVQASAAMDEYYLAYFPTPVTQSSPVGAVSLAERLRDAGVKMYGAFWCSHCQDQKQAFGADAMEVFPYQECYPEGWRAGIKLAPACEAAGIQAFPTWVIGSDRLEGEQSFEVLEKQLAKLKSST